MRIAALLLAAGRSTRMEGGNKLTATLRDRPLVCHAADRLFEASIRDVVVVTGHEAPAVREALATRAVEFVENPAFAAGMGSSIARGAAHLTQRGESAGVDGVLIALGDMPSVEPATIQAVISRFEGPDSIVAPVHRGRRGHPVLFGSAHFDALRALEGDRGAQEILEAHPRHVIEWGGDDPGILHDIDRRSDLEAAEDLAGR